MTPTPTDAELAMRLRREVLQEVQDLDDQEIVSRVRAILASVRAS
jgi:hypothetical protein